MQSQWHLDWDGQFLSPPPLSSPPLFVNQLKLEAGCLGARQDPQNTHEYGQDKKYNKQAALHPFIRVDSSQNNISVDMEISSLIV